MSTGSRRCARRPIGGPRPPRACPGDPVQSRPAMYAATRTGAHDLRSPALLTVGFAKFADAETASDVARRASIGLEPGRPGSANGTGEEGWWEPTRCCRSWLSP